MKDSRDNFLRAMLLLSVVVNPLCIAVAIVFYEISIGHFLFMVAMTILIWAAVFCAIREKCHDIFSFEEFKISGRGFVETWLFVLYATFITSLPFVTTH